MRTLPLSPLTYHLSNGDLMRTCTAGICYKMDPVLTKRGGQRAHKGLKGLDRKKGLMAHLDDYL
jgi:hypothetical protein